MATGDTTTTARCLANERSIAKRNSWEILKNAGYAIAIGGALETRRATFVSPDGRVEQERRASVVAFASPHVAFPCGLDWRPDRVGSGHSRCATKHEPRAAAQRNCCPPGPSLASKQDEQSHRNLVCGRDTGMVVDKEHRQSSFGISVVVRSGGTQRWASLPANFKVMILVTVGKQHIERRPSGRLISLSILPNYPVEWAQIAWMNASTGR